MHPKPTGCKGCKWYGNGQGFVPDEIPADAQVVFVCQNPGDVEEALGRPLIGPTGQILRADFVNRYLGGVKVGYANVVHCRAVDRSGRKTNLMPRPAGGKEWEAIVHYCKQHLTLPPDALIVACGEDAQRALTGIEAPVLHLRGSFFHD